MKRSIVTVLVVIGLVAGTVAAQTDGQIVHVVQPGENLFRIGLRYGVTAQQIASANRLSDASQIRTGQQLIIPAAGAANAPAYSPAATAQSYHVVAPGENLFRIALRYGLSIQALASANNIDNPSLVHVGQRLLIPGSQPAAMPGKSVLLRVPILGQMHSLTCEAAALRMVAAYMGKYVTEAWIQAQLGKDENPHKGFRGDNIDAEFGGIINYGVYAEPMARVLILLGLGAQVRYNTTYAELRAALDKGQPVIVWISQFPAPGYYERPGYRLVPGEHTYVVVGYDDKGYIVNDPLNGGRQFHIRAIPRWELFNNMALFVSRGS